MSDLSAPGLTRIFKCAGSGESPGTGNSSCVQAQDSRKASLTAAILDGVKAVDVTGFTKGRGFTGSVKRWNVACGRMTHGSRFHRRPGSLGTRTTPGRVFKGKPQPGQYGDEQRTIQNLRLLDVDTKNNVIAVYGSVPGHQNNYLFVKPSIKA
ncbi:MAG: 50S ribosomal protein L3 [Betaproteobacteria bacterium]|nr:50S ribosomal protein L3 [Betaproteobacteria bacterium]